MTAASPCRQRLRGFGDGAVERVSVIVKEHKGEAALAEVTAMNLDFTDGLTELTDRCTRTLVDEHLLFGPGFGGQVVAKRDALVEIVSAPHPQVAPHAVVRETSPFETGDPLARNGVQTFEYERRGCCWWILHRQDLHAAAADP